MNRSYRPWMVVALTAALASCASGMQKSSQVPARTFDGGSNLAREDVEYMSRVEQIARRRGVNVHWVNPPRTNRPLAAQQ